MNSATIGNLTFQRGADESVPQFKERVRASVSELGGGVVAWGVPEGLEWIEAEPEIITIEGGVGEDGSGDFATIGDKLIEREDGESIEDFHIRAREAARVTGAEFVAFGGLRLLTN